MTNKIELEYVELPYAINEEMKTLRTNIQFCGADKKVLLLTSAMQNEGKSTLSINLCRSLAELGKKVLLIDADLRKSVLADSVVSGTVENGLSQYLSGQCQLGSVFCQDAQENFYIIFAGGYPSNPVELLATEQMAVMLKKVRDIFDYVILDCAPLGVVTDAAVLAPHTDGAILVLNAGDVKYKMAQSVVQRLEGTGCPVLGVVLNQVGQQSNGRYYGYGRHYGYRKYGKNYRKYYKQYKR